MASIDRGVTGPTLFQRRLPALLDGAVERCCSTFRTLAFWLAVGLPVAYMVILLYPVGWLSTIEWLMMALGVHTLALIIGHRGYADRDVEEGG